MLREEAHYFLPLFDRVEIQKIFIASLQNEVGANFESLLFLMQKVHHWEENLHPGREISEILEDRIELKLEEANILTTFYNPLKVMVLLIEFLQKLALSVNYNKNVILRVKEKLYTLAVIYSKKITSEKYFIRLLLDCDSEQRKLIYIIQQNNLTRLVDNHTFQEVIDILWKGKLVVQNGIFDLYATTQILFRSGRYGNQSLLTSNNFYLALDQEYKSEKYYF